LHQISFMGANFVGRQVGYRMTGGWGQGDKAANDYFRPLETFEDRFGALLAEVRAMGFDAFDIWTGQLNWTWATAAHIAIARALLDRHSLAVPSYAGNYGSTAEEFEAACRLSAALGIHILGGSTPLIRTDRSVAVALLRQYNLRLGIENHPGLLTAEEMMAVVGDGADGLVGTTVDTGWYGTAEVDALSAIRGLGPHIFHVHLKDVDAPGAHVTCQYGRGCVPVRECVRALQELGYEGGISVEHEPADRDPTDECRANLRMLHTWLDA
jgi:sugar phosphate isomerase/epimerase